MRRDGCAASLAAAVAQLRTVRRNGCAAASCGANDGRGDEAWLGTVVHHLRSLFGECLRVALNALERVALVIELELRQGLIQFITLSIGLIQFWAITSSRLYSTIVVRQQPYVCEPTCTTERNQYCQHAARRLRPKRQAWLSLYIGV
eukprot:COSAG05_NODE_1758_length_4138_cov_1092.842783_5_plen_147_part_00